jgi:chromosome partitioning protein
MKLSVALMNRKAGTGKTTCAVWLAHAFAERSPVLLVDADPAASALEWSDLAADEGGFPFRVIGLPSKQLHQRVPDIARPDEVVVIDTPQTEDHAGIANSVMRLADEIVITCAPTPIEVNRTTPVREQIEEVEPLRLIAPRISVLLNRVITGTNSLKNTRDVLAELGYDVLRTPIRRAEAYAQSFATRPAAVSADPWRNVARELLARAGLASADDLAYLTESQSPDMPPSWWVPAREGSE